MNQHAGHEDDATAVVRDETVAVRDETVAVRDETVAVRNDTLMVRDETVAVRDETVAVRDETVAVRDETVVRAAPAGSAAAARQQRRELRREQRAAEVQRIASEAMPVAEPAPGRSLPGSAGSSARAGRSGLDPERVIGTAPGSMPWDALPEGERGLTQGLPVSYVARANTGVPLQTNADEVQRRLGPAPRGVPVRVREGREALPSLERRDRKRRAVTLVSYAGAVVVCVLGLWGVALLAFG